MNRDEDFRVMREALEKCMAGVAFVESQVHVVGGHKRNAFVVTYSDGTTREVGLWFFEAFKVFYHQGRIS